MAECQRYKVNRKAYRKSRHKRAMKRNVKWFYNCLISEQLYVELR